MKESDKNLLIKDLCSRIPYDTVVYVNGNGDVYLDSVNWYEEVAVRDYRTATYPIDDVKPYLRPMSSMTKEEREWYILYGVDSHTCASACAASVIDWLLAHHFDYRGLIEKGLALEAPEGMYN